MATTPNLHIPLIEHGEVNGDVTIQTGSQITDLHGQSIVEALTTIEPGSPAEGQAWIINGTPTGTNWGTDASPNQVAHFYGGVWNYNTPNEGWRFYNKGDTLIWKWDGIAWGIYIAGDIPPNQSFQAQEEFPPEGTPLALAVSASTWTKISFSSDASIGTELSYNGTTYELTYTGVSAVFDTSVDIIISGNFANDADYLIRIRNNTQNLTCCQSAIGLTNRQPNVISLSGSLLDVFNTSDVIVCEAQASHATTLNISGGWYVHKQYNL